MVITEVMRKTVVSQSKKFDLLKYEHVHVHIHTRLIPLPLSPPILGKHSASLMWRTLISLMRSLLLSKT